VERDTFTFSTILILCGRARRLSEATNIFKEATQQGLYIFLRKILQKKKCETVQTFAFCSTANLFVNEIVVASYISTVAKHMTISSCLNHVDELLDQQLPVRAEAYNNILAACTTTKDAESVADHMRKTNQHPNLESYNTLINIHAREGNTDRAYQVSQVCPLFFVLFCFVLFCFVFFVFLHVCDIFVNFLTYLSRVLRPILISVCVFVFFCCSPKKSILTCCCPRTWRPLKPRLYRS
jgi:pentatricopeptide repeat protein